MTAPSLRRLEEILAAHTVAEAIYNIPFEVKMPQRFTYDEEEMEIFGVNMSGNAEADERANNTEIRVSITISAIAEHRENGVPISIYRHEMVVIYELIVRHLGLWKNLIMQSNHSRAIEPPLEELRRLGELAQDIHEDAIQARTAENPDYILTPHPGSITSWTGGLGFSRNEPLPSLQSTVREPEPAPPLPKFDGIDQLLGSVSNKRRLF